jgi:hypothetical protein
MPAWLMRLVWKVRGKRLVRLHLDNDQPSVEGILAGRWSGHYVLLAASVYEGSDRSVSLTGHLEVPAERVLFVQVMS